MECPARAVARTHGIRVIELSCSPEAEAGLFTLSNEERSHAVSHGFAVPDDVAFVLHTSGTTARPKIVPLTHVNICTAAHNLSMALALVECDRCLNMTPLFHTYGLIAATLTSLMVGASIVYPPSFSASQFFIWLEEFRPTWYQAVPAVHQTILAHAAQHRDIIARCPLRFIRTGTAPLPLSVRVQLENVFNTRPIEVWGMLEASGPVTCNAPPSRQWKANSVGVSIGTEIAIMDEMALCCHRVKLGKSSCVVRRLCTGTIITQRLIRNAFTHGWFRSGDQGIWSRVATCSSQDA